MAQAGAASGPWPVAAGRLAAVLILLPTAARHLRVPPWRGAQALLIGAGATLGLGLYLLATRQQMLAVAVVLASLYPTLPVILGLTVLYEGIDRRQMVGLVGAAAASALLAVGRPTTALPERSQ
ncbi:multidrug DMT transporter permease [Streptomyces sp. NPDC059639]|uniref:multidrug DMT transporter permease n=1 Tax=Streptomyces sp. NPDC059639 TaxID=3346891 RepID=UPI003673EF8E